MGHESIERGPVVDYALQVAYRGIDYAEDAYDSYDASVLEIALRFSW